MGVTLKLPPRIHPIAATATGFTWGLLTVDRVSETKEQLILTAETERSSLVAYVDAQGYFTEVRVMNKAPNGLVRTDEQPMSLRPLSEPDADARLVVRTTVKGVGWGGAMVSMGYYDQKFYVQDPGGRWLFARHAALSEVDGLKNGTLLARN